jgi:hypothetical protein
MLSFQGRLFKMCNLLAKYGAYMGEGLLFG